MGKKTWPFTGYCFKGEREVPKYAKKKKSEGTGYQGHVDKKNLQIALRERKHIQACLWSKNLGKKHLLTEQRLCFFTM